MKSLNHLWVRTSLFSLFTIFYSSTGHSQSDLFLHFQSTSLDFPSLSEKDVRRSNQFLLQITTPVQQEKKLYQLRLTIEGRGITLISDGRPGSEVDLSNSTQLTLFSSDLAEFFDFDQMEVYGITPEVYKLKGLPEGMYTLCFSALDITNDRTDASSNQSCIHLYVRQNLPPEFIQPRYGELVDGDQPFLLQWVPRHVSASPVQYQLQIFEHQDDITAYELLAYHRPALTEETYATQFNYRVEDLRLKSGTTYVAFVRAEPLFNNVLFQNGGFSEPILFEIKKTEKQSRSPEEEIPEAECIYPASDVIINEFNFGYESRGAYIELLVTGAQTAGTQYSLEGWILDDNNFFPSNPYAHSGHIRLGECFQDIPRGSIVLIYDPYNLTTGIDPNLDGMPNGNGVYQVSLFNSSCFSFTENCPSNTDPHYTCTPQGGIGSWPNYAKCDQAADLIQLRRPDGDLEHAILWNTDDYELFPSSKVIYFDAVSNPNFSGFAFTSDNHWYTDANYAVVTGASQATPGEMNNTSNGNLIVELEELTDYNPFHILVRHEIVGNSSWAVIDIVGQTSNSSYEVKIDGVPAITYSLNNPIWVEVEGVGYHIITVKDLYTLCMDEGIVEVPSSCTPGTPCNDLNSCTSNDVLDAQCNCAGTPFDEVNFTVQIAEQNNCDYCMWLDPDHYENGLPYFVFESITIEFPTGGSVYLNELDNLDDDRNPVFNFPYCIGGDCPGGEDLTLLLTDLNAWLVNNGFIGEVIIGDGACGVNSLIFLNTNVTIVSAEAETDMEIPFNISFVESNCSNFPVEYGFYITAGLENCGELTGENEEEEVSWLWSSGAVTPYVFTPEQDDCYSVTVTCSDGCSYVGTFPEGGDCECTVGSPCIINGTDSLECRSGFYDENCDCVVGPFADADEDGVCDLADNCPGFLDSEDTDQDGYPDGCDLCEGKHDSLYYDGIPGNEYNPSECQEYPCDEETGITVTPIGQSLCDYCLNVSPTTTFPNDPLKYFKSLFIKKDNQPFELQLISGWQINNSESFEEGWGKWISGGSYVERIEEPEYADEGVYSARLRVNQINSNLYTQTFDMANTCQVRIDFSFKTTGFITSNDGFILEMSTNNGSSYSPVQSFLYTAHFVNEKRYHHSIYINSPFSHNVRFRFRTLGSNPIQKVHLDEIKISELLSTGYGCLSTDNDRFAFANVVDTWILQFANMDFQYSTGASATCGTGHFFQATNSPVQFQSISVIGNGYLSNFNFLSADCGDLGPQEYQYILTATSTCLESTFEWSTGQTSSSIQIPNMHAGYQVTITCEDDCEYVELYGDQNCLVGAPCVIPQDPCDAAGYLDELCNCVVVTSNTVDDDNNGIPDCMEPDCDCEPLIVYTEHQEPRYELCMNVGDVTDLIQGCTVYIENVEYILDESIFFDFNYCIGGGSICIDKPDFNRFRGDLYKWAVEEGYGDIRILLELDNENECGWGAFMRIENAPFDEIVIDLVTGNDLTASSQTPYDVTTGYNVSVDLSGCPECTQPEYKWSDGSNGSAPLISLVESPYIGYAVTITCQGCIYEIISSGDIGCIVGDSCSDGLECTTLDIFDINCNCVGVIEDESDADGDGVPFSCDKCEGFDDSMDDDADTVPNGCDECPGQNDLDPNVDLENCPDCEFVEIPVYRSSVYLDVKTWCYDNYAFINGFTMCFPEHINPQNLLCEETLFVDFTNRFPHFRMGYFICDPSDPQYDGTPYFNMINLFAQDLEAWLRNVMGDANASVSIINDELVIQQSMFTFHNLYINVDVDGSDGISPPFSRSTDGTILMGTPCDDGNPCTILDRWDEDCRCVGIFEDSDSDGVCDEFDECPGLPDFFDFNLNGIPDCTEGNEFICDDGSQVDFCEFLADVVTFATREDEIFPQDPPKVLHKNILNIQAELFIYFDGTEWKPLNMPYPWLIEDIRFGLDDDDDGIVNYLDPCPQIADANPFIDIGDITSACCDEKSWESMLIMYSLLFETVSFINHPTEDCYTSGFTEFEMPGCADELNIDVYMDEQCVLRALDGNCAIEFRIDCHGNCQPVYLGDPDGNHDCNIPEVIGVDCTISAASCVPNHPCEEWTIVGNPAYPADPNAPPCLCELVNNHDEDGDDVCDDVDKCPGHHDNMDNDLDGYPDDCDDCPNFPGLIGQPCVDEEGCTYAATISENCECVGHAIDLDDDGVFDCEPCDAAHDYDGDGYIDAVDTQNGVPVCDVCPGLDDTEDYDGDGIPDCLDPPFESIGCPDNLIFVEQTGIVLVFNSEDISVEDLPEPISTAFYAQIPGAGLQLFHYDYLTISNIRENAGFFEVLYIIEGLPALTDEGEFFYIPLVGITYADHQQCLLTDSEDDDNMNFDGEGENAIDLPCPTSFEMDAGEGRLILQFPISEDHLIDPAGFTGDIEINLSGGNGTVMPVSNLFNNASFSVLPTLLEITFSEMTHLGDPATYSGNIVLPNEISCPFVNGGLDTPCPDEHAVGDPCDDEDPCTHHDKLDDNCDCVGEASPDSENNGQGDGLCDAIDPCPDVVNDGPDNDGDGYPDCPCEGMEVTSFQLVNGNDLEVMLDLSNASLFSHIDVEVIGGPENISIGNLSFNNPLIIENLPFGYELTVELKGVCLTGGIEMVNLQVELPFYDGQYICGIEIKEVDISTLSLLPSMGSGDQFTASDFIIHVKHATGSYGKFTGDGYIKVPFLGNPRINVSFNEIVVSANNQMVQGVIKVDGFGVAVLGDDISDAINDGINSILDPLKELDEILEELVPLLEELDKLIETTGNLVSEEAKNCVLLAQQNLEVLQSQQPPATEMEIQAATTQLQFCMEQYNTELALILSGLSQFLQEMISTEIPAFCTTNQNFTSFEALTPYEDYKDLIDAPNSPVEVQLNNGFNDLYTHSVSNEMQIEMDGSPELQTAISYYHDEGNYLLCKINPLLADFINNPLNEYSPDMAMQMLKIMLTAGTDISKIIAADLKNQLSSHDIYLNRTNELNNALIAIIYRLSYK